MVAVLDMRMRDSKGDSIGANQTNQESLNNYGFFASKESQEKKVDVQSSLEFGA
jgi:hypothetical protein